jgi:histidyl-tRNA synthetase
MKEEFKAIRGTQDYLPEKAIKMSYVEGTITQLATLMGFREIRTPIFESTALFNRAVGDGTDLVNKEMYTFQDKGDRSITLRPEGTAGVIRAFVENKLYANPDYPVKLFYKGPLYRYERPQKGRYREFNQFGFEAIGTKNPFLDAELLVMAESIIRNFGYKNIELVINSIGDAETRKNYIEAIKKYIEPHLSTLCEDCQKRFITNPLRILDCKIDSHKEIFANVPNIIDYLSENAKEYFTKVVKILDGYQVPYRIDNKLVRGLDYYNDIVFEIHSTLEKDKSFGAIGGGGRYDHLVEEIGGPDLPAFGFAFGTDRLVELLDSNELLKFQPGTDIYIMPLDSELIPEAFDLMFYLRYNGFLVEMDYEGRSIKAQYKTVDKKNAKYAVLIGKNEFNEGNIIIRENASKTQEIIKADEILTYLDKKLQEQHEQHHLHDEDCDCEDCKECDDPNCNCQH